ncbi:sterol desaturase family protein [Sulfitobacter donghicola]|uniref:Fatty acid hydroxylase n=1 Tax=Sulfitobacter donghicola DSW-25 = KCTC 12864 = JCM 14565 TaxID=1300350 RepID=A0A073IME4_9RHOB|nr:sterol desaturase family protein [Sulfitobacter donghicola]KEJ90765.1 fatty acid hydroxylase [Sulfitobacter donghicola DSW-25 = KCTC 12864 = JCM 14565]KIN68025.1 Fatty acid hydroxylase [Sulfitobacter donghicola DSW-25 = KCTC 12864 = JCM 14565]
MELLSQIYATFIRTFTDLESRLAVFYLCITILIVAILWVVRGRPTSFVSYLLPKEVYLHKSNIVDIKIFLFNSILSAGGLFAAVTMTPVMTVTVLNALGSLTGASPAPVDLTLGKMALATLIMILTLDFCKYWAHRLHHETMILWPFHALHHSAEIMTPLTANRNHPVFLILRALIYTVIVGSVQALMLFLLMGKIEILAIGSVNAGYFMFNALGSNLRHSHVWLSYGPVMEHIFISPAQHHVHHSIDPKHYNKNYGEVFAIWDLMFGSLYVLRSHEKIEYGLADKHGERIEQPYPNLRTALLDPFADSWRALWKGTSRDPKIIAATKESTAS